MRGIAKKLLVVTLAIAMVMGLSVVSFAAKDPDGISIESFDGAAYGNLEAGQSITLTTASGGFEIHAYSCEMFDGCSDYVPDKSIKVYFGGKYQEKVSGRKLYRTITCDPTDVVTFSYKKGRLDITFTTAAPKAPETKVNPSNGKANQGANSTTAIEPKTAAEAKTLADYYEAVVKKNKLAGTGAPEEALLAYYKSLAKSLK